jgi:hypothetical protein
MRLRFVHFHRHGNYYIVLASGGILCTQKLL